MTYQEILDRAAERLGIPASSTAALARIGRLINDVYRDVSTSLGIDLSRRVVSSVATTTPGIQTVTFTSMEKIERLLDDSSGTLRVIPEVTFDQIRNINPGASDSVRRWAVESWTADTVTVRLDVLPQTEFDLKADGTASAATLDNDDVPAFPASFHDILVDGVLAEEYLRLEKPALADRARERFEKRLSDLRMWRAKTISMTIRQGETREGVFGSSSGSGGGGSAPSGGTSYTQTGLITFDRDPGPPFAVTADSTVVPNLIAESAETISNVTTNRLIGRDSPSTGDAEELEVTGGLEFTGAGSIQIAVDGVTYDKIQNVTAASRLLGRGSALGAGNVEEITLGTGLSLSGTVLSAAVVGGSDTQVQFNDAGTLAGDSGFTFNKTTDALTITGPINTASDYVMNGNSSLRRSTSDGSDTGSVSVTGGGAVGQTRGASVTVHGNEHASQPGKVTLVPGNITGSAVDFYNSAGTVATTFLGSTGIFSNLGTHLTTQGLVAVENSTTETSMFSTSIPANIMSTNRGFRYTAFYSVATDVASSRNVNFRVKFGGVTQLSGSVTFPIFTTNFVKMEVLVLNGTVTNIQRIIGTMTFAHTAGGNSWGTVIAGGQQVAGVTGGVDTTSAQTFQITAELDSAQVGFSAVHYAGILELI